MPKIPIAQVDAFTDTPLTGNPAGVVGQADGLTDQLVHGLRRAVRSGRYGPGAQLPTMAQIAAELGVSIIVVRHAMAS